MNGLTILSHSFRQIKGNLAVAVMVSAWLVAIYVAALAVLFRYMPEWLAAAIAQDSARMEAALDFSGQSVGMAAALLLLALVFLLWAASLVAITWHRYILLEEAPKGFLPNPSNFPIGKYAWRGLGITFLAALAAGLVGGVLAMIMGPASFGATATPAGLMTELARQFITNIVMLVLYLRMALVLPSLALGAGLTIGQAWEKSTGYTGAILGLAVLLALINGVVPLLISLLFGQLVWIEMALNGAFLWFYFMLNISVLSTLYGYIVQQREVH